MQKLDVQDNAVERLDLQLLNFLAALLQTASITRAGEQVGWSQPNASRASARLRQMLGDPLLVRTSGGYASTPFAVDLLARVQTAQAALRNVLQAARFDPLSSTRRFTLATTDYGALAVLPEVLPLWLAQSPRTALVTQPWANDTLTALEQGELDLALYADADLPQDFHYRTLFAEQFGLLMRENHPLQAKLDADADLHTVVQQAAQYPQIVARYPEGREFLADDVLARLGSSSHRVAVESSYFATAAWMLGDTDLLMALPLRAAQRLARVGRFAIRSLPAGAPVFSYRMVWHERAHRDPGHQWLRQLIGQAFSLP